MAQRLVHYLFGELISEKIDLKDKNRFLVGNIMPDAYVDVCERDLTHFKHKIDEYTYFDFEGFRDQFAKPLLRDDLYLGYYMHLILDACYRKFTRKNQLNLPKKIEEVAILHNDYHLLNSHIVERYGIKDTIVTIEGLQEEPICKLAKFQVNEFIRDMENDFTEKPQGTTYYLTENELDAFIDQNLSVVLQEIQAVQKESAYLKVKDYVWKRSF